MKRLTTLLSLILLGFAAPVFSTPARAEDDFHPSELVSAGMFGDWLKLAEALQLNGIDPATVNWQPIEMRCLPLKTSSDETQYNRCKYDNAWFQNRFAEDRASCEQRTRAEFPDSLKRERAVRRKTQSDAQGNITQTETTTAPGVSKTELNDRRSVAYADCMRSKRWYNPNRWEAGQFVETVNEDALYPEINTYIIQERP